MLLSMGAELHTSRAVPYYCVGFYGAFQDYGGTDKEFGNTGELRNKEFVYRSQVFETLSVFAGRMLKKYPGSTILRPGAEVSASHRMGLFVPGRDSLEILSLYYHCT